jgi:hypothetical protein
MTKKEIKLLLVMKGYVVFKWFFYLPFYIISFIWSLKKRRKVEKVYYEEWEWVETPRWNEIKNDYVKLFIIFFLFFFLCKELVFFLFKLLFFQSNFLIGNWLLEKEEQWERWKRKKYVDCIWSLQWKWVRLERFLLKDLYLPFQRKIVLWLEEQISNMDPFILPYVSGYPEKVKKKLDIPFDWMKKKFDQVKFSYNWKKKSFFQTKERAYPVWGWTLVEIKKLYEQKKEIWLYDVEKKRKVFLIERKEIIYESEGMKELEKSWKSSKRMRPFLWKMYLKGSMFWYRKLAKIEKEEEEERIQLGMILFFFIRLLDMICLFFFWIFRFYLVEFVYYISYCSTFLRKRRK